MLHLGNRALMAIAIFALLLSAFAPQPTAADTIDRSTRFGTEDQTFEAFKPAVGPTGADLDKLVRVVVKLSGVPVALVKAANPGKQIDQAQRDSVKSSLQRQQAALRPQIEALGGRVLGQYQSAINGLKVEIARRNLASLATLNGVSGVDSIAVMTADNATSVPYIGAPQVWAGRTGLRGERVKIGIIDTGVDYTHANFGGPGTTAAFDAAFATNTAPADPRLFGPRAPKVKGGIDLVGDDYDANDPTSVPVPDPNPLDCNGHGSHVAGTAAGFGVTGSGATYSGPYDTTTSFASMTIGPGVAPKADLYAIRVFGCAGSTDVTVDAIDWAVDHDLDVINMSLGSSFGASDDASAEASDNAAKSGVVVVASAGNSGHAPYIVGSPSTATRALSVAANDATSSFPGVTLAGAANVTGINANGATFANGLTLQIKVLMNGTNIALGCDQADYAGTAGMLVVVQRGTCARVARAIYGQKAGAKAVLMVNTSEAYPPYEGKITSNPDTGEAYTVTIPFIGTKLSTAAALKAADGGTVTLTNSSISNPTYTAIADFSSGGARMRDSNIKPDVAAPGVSTLSTASGTGNQGERLSGTSMAAPHATGVAALVLQSMGRASRDDDEDGNGIAERVKAAITNTASSTAIGGFSMQTAGAGLVQPIAATKTRVVATGDAGTGSLSFGYAETRSAYTATKKIGLEGLAKGDGYNQNGHRFTVSSTPKSGPAHTISLSSNSVRLDEGEHRSVRVTLSVNPANSNTADVFQDVAGTIDFTPVGGTNNGVTLHVPYYMVFRGSSNLDGSLSGAFNAAHPDANVNLTNAAGAITAGADFYTLGVTSPNQGHGQTDLRAAGGQIFQSSGLMVFAVNTWSRYSNAAVNEVDIYVDVDRDGVSDYIVFGADNGLVRTGSRDGVFSTFVYNTRTGSVSPTGDATYLTDNSTVYLYAFRTQLRQTGFPARSLTAGNPRFTYEVDVFAGRDGTDDIGSGGIAQMNAYSPSLPTGQFATVARNGTATVPVHINVAEWAQTPALGVMIVGLDNAAGSGEAKLLLVTP
jgi:minor extracellular serine protease Vpr